MSKSENTTTLSTLINSIKDTAEYIELKEWLKKEKEKGLTSIGFDFVGNEMNSTLNNGNILEVVREMNMINRAADSGNKIKIVDL